MSCGLIYTTDFDCHFPDAECIVAYLTLVIQQRTDVRKFKPSEAGKRRKSQAL